MQDYQTYAQNGDAVGGSLCGLQGGGSVCHDQVNACRNKAVGDGNNFLTAFLRMACCG